MVQRITFTFHNLCHSLFINFLVLLSNKEKQQKDTSMPNNCTENSIFFSIYLLEILDKTKKTSFNPIQDGLFWGCSRLEEGLKGPPH